MPLIPLASFISIVNGSVSLACAIIIWVRKREAVWKDRVLSLFFLVFIFSAFEFYLFGLPGTLVRHLLAIQVVQKSGDFFVLLLTTYIISIPLSLFPQSRGKKFVKVVSWVILSYAVFYLAHNLIFIKPARMVNYGPFVDWQGQSDQPVLQTLLWFFTAMAIFLIVFFFVINGWKHKDGFVRRRSRLFAIGFALIFIGWFSIFLFASPASQNMTFLLAGGTFGSFIISIGLTTLLVGVFSQPQKEIVEAIKNKKNNE